MINIAVRELSRDYFNSVFANSVLFKRIKQARRNIVRTRHQ